MEIQNGKEYDWIKIEELLQPSTRIRKLQWIWQTATSKPIIEYLGKRMVHNMTELFSPQAGQPDLGSLLPHFSYTYKAKNLVNIT
jgi:hypothetical protein